MNRRNPPVRRIGDSVHDFRSALQYVEQHGKRYPGGGTGKVAKLAHNTKIHMAVNYYGLVESIAVELHHTDIVTYYPDGRIKLDSGGYRSRTTAQRMNQLLPPWLGVVQRKGEWYVENLRTRDKVPFEDGMIVSAEFGEPIIHKDNPGKFDNVITEGVYNALNAGAVVLEEGWERGDGGEWMYLLTTDVETIESYSDDEDEVYRLFKDRRKFPVGRDGRVMVFISGDELGRVGGVFFDSYQEGRDYWAREMRNMEYDEEDEDDEDGDE